MTFGYESTTDEVLDGVDLSGMWVLITGASTGLGQEAARAMAATARIVLAVRDVEKGERARGSDRRWRCARRRGPVRRRSRPLVARVGARLHGPCDRFVRPLRPPDRERRRDDVSRRTNHRRLRDADRHQPHRPLRPREPARPEGRVARTDRVPQPRPGTGWATSTSTIPTSRTSRTTRSPRTAAPRPPTCCSPSNSTAACTIAASARAQCTRARSSPSSDATSPTRS